MPGFGRAGGFIGLFAPKATPAPVVAKISHEVEAILKLPHVEANVQRLTATVDYEDGPTFAANLAGQAAQLEDGAEHALSVEVV